MDLKERGIKKRKKLKAADMPTTNHLLVIGINAYSNGIPSLNNAVKDAKAFEALLKRKYDFKEENITSLYDKDATRDNIFDAFDNIIAQLTADDNLVFYFSGHGELIETTNQGYWIPIEARANKRGSYLINTEIKNFVAACKARHIFGIVDACYSGSLLRKINNPLLQKYYTRPSRRIMTSGQLEPVPDGLPNNHSPFAAALLNALAYNQKPYLSASALWQEMQEGLAANSFASAQFETMHGVGHQGGDFFFLATEFDDIPEVEQQTDNGKTKNITEPIAQAPIPEKEEDLSHLSIEDWRVRIKQIASNNLKKAFTLVEHRINSSTDAFNNLLLLQARYYSANKNKTMGLVSDQQSNISFNQIKFAFFGFLDDLEEEDLR